VAGRASSFFNTTGYLSLVEKYEFKRHKRKQAILRKLVSSDVLDLIYNNTVVSALTFSRMRRIC
jgi:hypothetical protein